MMAYKEIVNDGLQGKRRRSFSVEPDPDQTFYLMEPNTKTFYVHFMVMFYSEAEHFRTEAAKNVKSVLIIFIIFNCICSIHDRVGFNIEIQIVLGQCTVVPESY